MSDRFYVVTVPVPVAMGLTKCFGPFANQEVAQAVAQGYPRQGGDLYPRVYEVEKP